MEHYAMSVLLKFNNALLFLVNVYLPPSQNRSQFSSLWTKLKFGSIHNYLYVNSSACVIDLGGLNAKAGAKNKALFAQFQ